MKNQNTLKILNDFKNEIVLKLIVKMKADEALKIKDIIPKKLEELNTWIRLKKNYLLISILFYEQIKREICR